MSNSQRTKKSKEIEVEIDLLAIGQVMVSRSNDLQKNKELLALLADIGIDINDISEFFECQERVEQIIGEKTLCG